MVATGFIRHAQYQIFKNNMLAKLSNFFIISHAILTILRISSITVLESFVGKVTRKKIDVRFFNWADNMLKKIKLSYTVHNKENLVFEAGERYILMCNHASLYDIPLSVVALGGNVRMMAKKELIRVPIWGRAMQACDFISIDRRNRHQAAKDLVKAGEVLEDGIVLWIAPEGTRSRTGKMLPFKGGGFKLAMTTKAKIIPIGIRGAYDILPPKTTRINKGLHVDIHVGKPVDARDYEAETRDMFLNHVQEQIRELSGQS